MSILVQLEKFGITKDQIHNLSESEIIRFEKKLKAEARFDETISINDIEAIITSLKNNQHELALFLQDDFAILRRIISAPDRAYVANLSHILPSTCDTDRFRQFIEDSFSSELSQFFDNCIQNDFYNALYSLFQFKVCLSARFLDRVRTKYASKIVYATECIRIEVQSIESKIDFACNPFLYRGLTQLGAGQFDDEIRDLLNTSLRHSISHNLRYRLIYAMGFFETSDASIADLLKSNQEIAYRKGVREVLISEVTQRKTGSTSIDQSLVHKPAVNRQPPSKNVYQGRREANGGGRGALGTALSVIALVILIIRVIAYNSRSSYQYTPPSSHYSSQDFDDQIRQIYDIQEENSNEERERKREELRQIIENAEFKPELKPNSTAFEDIINYLNSDSANILITENIPLRIEKTGLNKRTTFEGGVDNVNIRNLTFERMLIMVKSPKWERWEFIEPGDSLVVSSAVREYRVYTGYDPEMVSYKNGNGEQRRHFRFKEVTNMALKAANLQDSFHSIFYENSSYVVDFWYDQKLRYSINGIE